MSKELFKEFEEMCNHTCCQDCKYLGSGEGWKDCMMMWAYNKGISDAIKKLKEVD